MEALPPGRLRLTVESLHDIETPLTPRDNCVMEAGVAVVGLAYAWWAARRPVAWNEAQHLAHPRVNCMLEAEQLLASAVARLVTLEQAP